MSLIMAAADGGGCLHAGQRRYHVRSIMRPLQHADYCCLRMQSLSCPVGLRLRLAVAAARIHAILTPNSFACLARSSSRQDFAKLRELQNANTIAATALGVPSSSSSWTVVRSSSSSRCFCAMSKSANNSNLPSSNIYHYFPPADQFVALFRLQVLRLDPSLRCSIPSLAFVARSVA